MIRPLRTFSFRSRAAYGAGAVLASVFLFSLTSRATPLELDLGENLGYFRVHTLPADLPPAATKARPLVLDLRFSTATDGAANALEAWVKFRATAATPVFVLVNSATPSVFRGLFASFKSQPGFLTIGPASDAFTPDIAIEIDPAAGRRAYDALEHGTSVDALTRQNADKPRNDEASLMHERASPAEDSDDALADLSDHDEEPPPPPPAPPPPLADLALERAIEIHRALLALKRL